MKTIKARKRTYRFVTNMESNLKVQEFIRTHSAHRSAIKMQVNKALYGDGDRLMTIRFGSTMKRAEMCKELRTEFEYYNLGKGKILVFLKKGE